MVVLDILSLQGLCNNHTGPEERVCPKLEISSLGAFFSSHSRLFTRPPPLRCVTLATAFIAFGPIPSMKGGRRALAANKGGREEGGRVGLLRGRGGCRWLLSHNAHFAQGVRVTRNAVQCKSFIGELVIIGEILI